METLRETPRLQQPTEEARKEWLKNQQAIHGKEKVPDEMLEPDIPGFDPHETESVVGVFGELTSAPADYVIGGKRVRIEEPTIGQIKNRLLPLLKGLDTSGTSDDIFAQLDGLNEFQLLIMDCVSFEEGQAPESSLDWSNGLKVSEGLKLAEALAESLDWRSMIERATAIQGKIKGVRGKAYRS